MSNPFAEIYERLGNIEGFLLALEDKLTPTTPPPVAEPDRYIDQKAFADIFGVSTVSVWSWEKEGLLKSYRIGNLKRFKYSEVMNSPKLIEREQKKGGQKQ